MAAELVSVCVWMYKHIPHVPRPVNDNRLQVYVILWSGPQHSSQMSSALHGLHVQHFFDQANTGQKWTAQSTHQFLLGLALLTAGLITMTCARAFLYAFGGLRAAKGLHQKLVNSILDADLSLLSRVPNGRLYARLSSDTETIDDSVPFISNTLLASTAGFCAALAVMVACQPTLLVLLAPLAMFCLHVQADYR
jgi:ABC-type siderophore export system fused ATPase/permease subunit